MKPTRRTEHARTPLDHALNDGEDYELLLTGQLDSSVLPIIRIGQIVSGSSVLLQIEGKTEALEPHGWEHRL